MSRTLESAKEILAKAIEYGAFQWDDPDSVTDADVLVRADELVDAALQHSRNGSVNEALLELLFAAQVEPLSEPTREAYTRRFGQEPPAAGVASSNGQGEHSVESPAAPAQADASAFGGRESLAADEPQQDEMPSIEDVFPGYDDLKVAEIKKAIELSAESGDLSEEEWRRIRAYEAAHEERKTILELQPEFRANEPEPAPAAAPETHDPITHDALAQGVADLYAGQSETRAQQERLPIPPATDSDHPPVLPIDITNVSDQELSRVATAFHSLFARAQWLISQEEGRERAAEHLEREAERDAFVSAYELHRGEIPEEKRAQPTALEAARKAAERDAEHAGPVRTWRARKVRHGIEARELKALSSGYDKAVWRVNEELQRRARLVTTRPASS